MEFLVQGTINLTVSKVVMASDEASALQKMNELFNTFLSQMEQVTYRDENGEIQSITVDDFESEWDEATNKEDM
ncbi:hypothetical protein [Priestia aryabhattai]|uniref:hypothetical protein n=1 Tax=Priestia aryabhattai TaxID=412384 RepID=UPI0015F608DA|nr:hypothetical protein [Priestia aryabhattai]